MLYSKHRSKRSCRPCLLAIVRTAVKNWPSRGGCRVRLPARTAIQKVSCPTIRTPDFNKYNAIAKSKVKLNDFRTAHPGFTKGIGIAGIVALAAGTFYLSLKDDNAALPQLTESTNELPEDQNRSLAIDAGQDDSIAADTDQDDSISTEVLSEPDHRKYAPRNPDDYETVMYSLGMIMVRLHEGWHPSQEKIDEFKEQTGEDLPPDMTFRSPHEQPYQVKKT